jgi:uncharacterized membrane protein YccC
MTTTPDASPRLRPPASGPTGTLGRNVRAALRVEPGLPALGLGARMALIIVTPLAIGLAADRLGEAVVVVMSALNVGMVDMAVGGSYAARARAMAAATVSCAIVITLGGLAGLHTWSGALLAGLLGLGAGLMTALGGSAATVTFFTAVVGLVGIGLPIEPADALERLWLAAVGGGWVIVVSLALWPLRPLRPARRAVGGVYAALADRLEAAVPTPEQDRRVRAAVESAEAMLLTTRHARAGTDAAAAQLVALVEVASSVGLASRALREEVAVAGTFQALGDVEPTFEAARSELARDLRGVSVALAHGVQAPPAPPHAAVADMQRVLDGRRGSGDVRAGASAREVLLSLRRLAALVDDALDLAGGRREGRPEPLRRGARASPAERLRASLTWDSTALRYGLRLGLALAATELVVAGLDLSRGYWATLTVAFILRPALSETLQRTLMRVGGTALGAIIGAILGATITSDAVVLAIIGILSVAAFSLINTNYGLAVLFLTPLIVLLIELIRPRDWELADVRVLDTIIGAAIGLLAGYALWPGSERRRTTASAADALRGAAAYARAVGAGAEADAVHEARRRALRALDDADAAITRRLDDPLHAHAEADGPASVVWLARSVCQAVAAIEARPVRHGVPRTLPPDAAALLTDAARTIDGIADAVEGGGLPDPPDALERDARALRRDAVDLAGARRGARDAGSRDAGRGSYGDVEAIWAQSDRLVAAVRLMDETLSERRSAK